MTWWYWLVLGLVLIALEMASSGGFYIIFFGVAAIVVALLAATGLAEASWLQWLLFSVLSVASLLFFRNPPMRKLNLGAGAPDIDTLIVARLLQAIGGSMMNPVALSIVSQIFTGPVERARALGIWGSVVGIAMSLGPIVGGLLGGKK